MSPLDELVAALAGTPRLPGARCKGQHELFDPLARGEITSRGGVAERHSQALALCQQCPSLTRCGEWVDGLPKRQQPKGVVAGRVKYAAS